MNPRFLVIPGLSLAALVFAACSSQNSDTPTGQGGASQGSGGAVSSGGGSPPGNGGAPGSGGISGGLGGQVNGSGGAVASGGLTGVGGTSSPGGTTSSGGTSSPGSGGKSNAGGKSGSGGSGTGGAATTGEKFSFFVTSLGAMRELSKNQDGFGGDLRFGEADGLTGADKICRTIAEKSMPGAGSKTWRAFLSTVKGPVNAIDRIGDGPWYDRLGRLVAANKTDILNVRPKGADPAIINDLPNENGIPNHQDGKPGCTGNSCPDNHDTLTGTGPDGKLYSTNMRTTCNDWTSAVGEAPPTTGTGGRGGIGFGGGGPWCGHSWPRMGSGENWMSAIAEGGCAPGVNLEETGGPQRGVYTVGTGGGYGGIYCFALTP